MIKITLEPINNFNQNNNNNKLSAEYCAYQNKLNSPYSIIILIPIQSKSKSSFPFKLNTIFKISLHYFDQIKILWGKLTQIQIIKQNLSTQYKLTLSPLNYNQTINQINRAYYGARLDNIILDIVQNLKSQNINYLFTLNQNLVLNPNIHYPILPVSIQYQESDYQYLFRLLRQHGVTHYYTHTQSNLILNIQDQNHSFKALNTHNNPIHILKNYSKNSIYLNQNLNQNSISIYNFQETIIHTLHKNIKHSHYDEITGQTHTLSHTFQHPNTQGEIDILSPFIELTPHQFKAHMDKIILGEESYQNIIQGFFTGLAPEVGQKICIKISENLPSKQYLITETNLILSPHTQLQYYFKATELNQNYHPRYLLNKHRAYFKYPGAYSQFSTYTPPNQFTVTPDKIGRIPIRYPFSYQKFYNNFIGRYTRKITDFNHKISGYSTPLYQDSLLTMAFANGQLEKPQIIGVNIKNNFNQNHIQTHHSKRIVSQLPQGQSWIYSTDKFGENYNLFKAEHSQYHHLSFWMINQFNQNNQNNLVNLDFIKYTSANYLSYTHHFFEQNIGEHPQSHSPIQALKINYSAKTESP